MHIGFNLAIFEDHNHWKNLFNRSGKTRWPNKAWEIEGHSFGWGDLIAFEFAWTRKTDHAGVRLKLGLLGYQVEAQFYDTRHWDEDTNDYVVYDEAYRQRHFVHREPDPVAVTADQLSDIEAFLKSPQGQRLIDKLVQEKLEQQKKAKLDKAARGEVYKAANLAKQEDQ